MKGEGEDAVDDYPLSHPDVALRNGLDIFLVKIFKKYIYGYMHKALCLHIPVAAEQQPQDEQTNWPQTW